MAWGLLCLHDGDPVVSPMTQSSLQLPLSALSTLKKRVRSDGKRHDGVLSSTSSPGLFIQQTFINCLFCVMQCAGHQG